MLVTNYDDDNGGGGGDGIDMHLPPCFASQIRTIQNNFLRGSFQSHRKSAQIGTSLLQYSLPKLKREVREFFLPGTFLSCQL